MCTSCLDEIPRVLAIFDKEAALTFHQITREHEHIWDAVGDVCSFVNRSKSGPTTIAIMILHDCVECPWFPRVGCRNVKLLMISATSIL